MDPLDFLAAVLPSSGVYCVCELSTKEKEHAFTATLQDLQPHIERFNAAKFNTYFALASFVTPLNRTAENARFIRALFLDLDCGTQKGAAYLTKSGAVDALNAFLQKTGLPTPWLNSSGNGVHVYWPFTEHVTIKEWKPVAENLKRLCKQEGLGIDFTVTADTARVLRMPGTANWKDKKRPKLCSIKQVPDVTHHTFAELTETIRAVLRDPISEKSTLFDVPGERLPTPVGVSATKGLENSVTFFKAILDRTAAGTGCKQLAHYLEHASEEGMEPLWRGMLSLAKVCSDGDKAARYLSKLHPYDDTRMQTKLREIKGPYPCVKFDSENPGVCGSCQHWGKITNPLTFGHEVATDNTEKQVTLPRTEATSERVTVTRPTPPPGYAYGKNGGVYRQIKEEDTNGEVLITNKMILLYDLFAVDILNNGEDGHIVHLMALRPEGATSVILPQRSMGSKDDVIKALAAQNIVAAYGSGNDKPLFDYVRACVEEISASRRAVQVPIAFGWQKDKSFVLNSKVYTPKGEAYIPMPKLANVVSVTDKEGTLEGWRQVPNLLISKGNFDILAMMLVGFGSPLMNFPVFRAYKALTFHIGSSKSGTGKSLALNLAASIWGPDSYIIVPDSSLVAQEHRIGVLGQLPLIIDEITEANKDFEWLAKFVMNMSSGQGKTRMKGAANEERLNTTFWRALMLLASNTHTTDFFSAVRKKMAEGHLRRLLELKMNKILTWEPHEKQTLNTLQNNFGVAGDAYVKWLVRNYATAEKVVNEVFAALDKEMNTVGDERFWVAGCAACIAGGYLAGKDYANIIDLPMVNISNIFKQLIHMARGIVKSSQRSAEDILNAYTREFFGQFVVVRINDQSKMLETTYGGGVVDKTITRSKVCGRVEHDMVPGHIRYYIEEQQLRAFCSSINYGYADFKTQLEEEFVVTYVKKDMLSKTLGPQMRVNAIQITRPETDLVKELEDNMAVASAPAG